MNLDLKKHWQYGTGFGLTLWYIGFGLQKYSNYLTGFGLTLSVYGILNLDLRKTQQGLPHRTTLNAGLELINEPSRNVVTKVWRLSWINCFLPFNIVLIHATFTAPSFGNLCITTSPATLLCILCSSGCCMSLSHMSITHLECFPIL